MNATYELQTELLNLSNSILGIKIKTKNGRENATPEQLKKLTDLGFNSKIYTRPNIIKFPHLKVIHSKAIKQICKKYNLINGPIDRFIGEIPKRNADEILTNVNYIQNKLSTQKDVIRDFNGVVWDGYYFLNDFGNRNFNKLKKDKEIFIKRPKKIYYHTAYQYKKISGQFKITTEEVLPDLKIKIIAPITDFNTKGMKVKNKKLKVKDPIVIAKVDDSLWCVLTAWGPEAEDANIFNELKN